MNDYLHTDWSAMTRADWAGLIIVLSLTALMAGLYVWVFKPRNRDRFEQYRNFVNQNDKTNGGGEHGRAN